MQVVILLIPTVITLYLLIHYYPNTGLGRIISIPTTLLINLIIILIGLLKIKQLSVVFMRYSIWIVVIITTIIITVVLHPQEYGASVINKIMEHK